MLEQLAETVRTHRPTRTNQAFPDWLRAEVVAAARPMLEQGHSLQVVAEAVGISATSLHRWTRSPRESASFRPVVVEHEQPAGGRATFEVRSPRGYVVGGLDLEEVAALLGRLG
jgi:transposase-like protein